MPKRKRLDVREVYFVQAFELKLIKIGVTNNTQRRIVSMQTLSPDRLAVLGVQLCPRGGALEKRLHRQFAHLRDHGEWYLPSPDLLSYIEANTVALKDVAAARADLAIDDAVRARLAAARERQQVKWLRENGFGHLAEA